MVHDCSFTQDKMSELAKSVRAPSGRFYTKALAKMDGCLRIHSLAATPSTGIQRLYRAETVPCGCFGLFLNPKLAG